MKNGKTENKTNPLMVIAILVGGFLFFALIFGLFGSNDDQDETVYEETPSKEIDSSITNFLTYDSYVYGIRIKYPLDWTKEEQVFGTVVSFSSPIESASDDFSENLNVLVQDLSAQPITLEEYTRISEEQVEQYITNGKILDTIATTLDGNSAYKLVYTGKQGQYNIKWMQVYTIKDDKAYVITYTAEMDSYSNFLGTAQEMINSFEIV